MKNFSEISDNLKTQKDRLCESFAAQSGLPQETVSKIYEDIVTQTGADDVTVVSEKFKSLLDVNLKTFKDSVDKLLQIFNDYDKDQVNDTLLNFLSTEIHDSEESGFYKILLYILCMKDKKNFEKLAMNNQGQIDGALFESVGINPDFVKEGRVPTIVGVNDDCDIKAEIEFYGDLKTLLSRNNKRWGYNYQLTNVHEAILLYLDKEIEYLTNKDNITSLDDEAIESIIKQMFTGRLNVMYRDVNYLRTVTPDIQGLVFDMMCLVMAFVRSNSQFCRYLSRETFDDFLQAFRQLYAQISSSRQTSRILVPYEKPDTTGLNDCETECTGRAFQLEILEGVFINTNKYDVWNQPIKVETAVDALYIIKSCSVDFNFKIRPYISNFITKGFEFIGKVEHVMLEASKFNKNKNSW